MNIMARINARKIVLSYFYQRNFFLLGFQQETIISDILFANNVFASETEVYADEKKEFLSQIADYERENTQEIFAYFIDYFFDQWNTDVIDTDYVFSVGGALDTYRSEIIEEVNKHINSFEYEKMSLINQSIFALGYIEWKVLKTEKEVLINEMIELAKRYDEVGSPKLLNAVMHKIVNQD